MERKTPSTKPIFSSCYVRQRKNSDIFNRSAGLSHRCSSTEIDYTNVFAVPLVGNIEANGSPLSAFESFFSTMEKDCTYQTKFGKIHMPVILAPASALTITRTSFGSFARSTTAIPSPSPTAQNPVVLATAPAHTQNDLATPHSDNVSSKTIPSLALQSGLDRPVPISNPSPVAQPALDPPPLPAPVPTRVSKPQSAGPKPPLIQHNANAPGKFDS